MTKYVFIPFSKEQSTEEPKYHKEKKEEWDLVKSRGIKHAGLKNPLAVVQNGDTIYIQAHGFRNSQTTIGSSDVSLDSQTLLKVLLKSGLTAGKRNLTIKIWACFSGLHFAKLFYLAAKETYPGLKVHGYKGETRLDNPKKIKPAAWDEDGEVYVTAAKEENAKAHRVEFP